jgi:hypothetical protein
LPGIDPASIYVWVHSWWGRGDRVMPYQASIEESDLAGKWHLHKQPKGQDRDAYYMATIDKICRMPRTKFMLRIEDDTIVSRNLLHNVCSWPILRRPKFGMGFLTTCDRITTWQAKTSPTDDQHTLRFRGHGLHFGGIWIASTAAVLNCMSSIRTILGVIARARKFGPTTSVSDSLFNAGYELFIHVPALGYIDVSIPSHQLGDVSHRYGNQPFDPEFSR